MKGTITKIQTPKPFGFIKVEGDNNEYFFHRDDYLGNWGELCSIFSPAREIQVTFVPESAVKGNGLRARNVELA